MNNEKYLYQSNNESPKINAWFAFPGVSMFGMSSLGFLTMFKELDMNPNVYAEKIFTDTKTTAVDPKHLDIIGFSNSFEIDFLSIFKILENYNIPIFRNERDENAPLVYVGGPVVSANPMPYCDFFDFFCIGDGVETGNIIYKILLENKGKPKEEILKLLGKEKGILVPSLEQKEVIKSNDDVSECLYTPIISENSFFKDTLIIELLRGCPIRCGFCMASYLNLPLRISTYESIIEAIDSGLKHTNKIAFLGAMIAAHPEFEKICDYVNKKMDEGREIELSVSSLRADKIDQSVIKTLVRAGQKHSTIAIEAGSERLRRAINKKLSEEQIFESIKVARENGLKGFKIYAMIGLPTETDEDINLMIDLMKRLKNQNKGFDLTLSVSTFVPKASTPFQFCGREETKSLEKKINYLKKELHKLGITFRPSSVDWDYWQAVLSRGDSRLGKYIYDVYKEGGNLGAFKQAYKRHQKAGLLPPPDYYATRNIETNEELPWDCINIGICKEALVNEYNRLINS